MGRPSSCARRSGKYSFTRRRCASTTVASSGQQAPSPADGVGLPGVPVPRRARRRSVARELLLLPEVGRDPRRQRERRRAQREHPRELGGRPQRRPPQHDGGPRRRRDPHGAVPLPERGPPRLPRPQERHQQQGQRAEHHPPFAAPEGRAAIEDRQHPQRRREPERHEAGALAQREVAADRRRGEGHEGRLHVIPGSVAPAREEGEHHERQHPHRVQHEEADQPEPDPPPRQELAEACAEHGAHPEGRRLVELVDAQHREGAEAAHEQEPVEERRRGGAARRRGGRPFARGRSRRRRGRSLRLAHDSASSRIPARPAGRATKLPSRFSWT